MTEISFSDSSLVQTDIIDIVLHASLFLMVEVWDDLMLVSIPNDHLSPQKYPKTPRNGGIVQFCLLFGADTIDIVWHAYLLLLARVRLVGPT